MSYTPVAIDITKPVLEITPGDIKINLVPNKDHVVELKLKNLTNTNIAFKVKTTAPDKYQVRPIQSLITAGDTSTCMIVLKGMPPPLESMKHKFLIQSLPHDGENEIGAFWKLVESNKREDKRPTFHDQRIVCTLVAPPPGTEEQPAPPAAQQAVAQPAAAGDNSRLQSQLDDKTKEFDGLMDFTLKQNGQIKQLTQQLQTKNEENENLKRTVQQLEKANALPASGQQNVSVPAPVSSGLPVWSLAIAFVAGLGVGAAVF